jgi:hypothetical protein
VIDAIEELAAAVDRVVEVAYISELPLRGSGPRDVGTTTWTVSPEFR